MKILITGATGFIGRYVVQRLTKTPHDIVTTSTRATGMFNGIQHVPCNLNANEIDYYKLFDKPDTVIHLAWRGVKNDSELFHIEENLWSSYQFLKHLIESGTRNIIVIGTCIEYGLQEGCLSEDLIPKPNTTYGIAKNTLRVFIEELQKKVSFNFKWIRPFYMYGEGQNENSVLMQLKSALDRSDKIFNMSGGEQLRDYLPVEAIAENIVKITLQNEVQGIINNCSGKPISVRRLVEEYLKRENKTIDLNLGYYPYKTHEPYAFWGCTQKLDRIIENDA